MIFSRLASLLLRLGQFLFAAIVLGLTAYFLHAHNRYGVGPFGRLVYSVIWSSLSIIAAIIWAIPTTSSMTGYVSDLGKSHIKMTCILPQCSSTNNHFLVFTAGWAAVFGLLVQWFNGAECGSAWDWTGFSLRRSNQCGQWKAAQAFSFLSMVFWFATFLLGLITVHRLSKRAAL
jgi:hypothetical protein